MPTVQENLETARTNISAEIAAISANLAKGYSIDGQTVQEATDYLLKLQESLKNIEIAINSAAGPYEVISQGI